MSSVTLRVAVAASGGLDSTALLHCTARAAAQAGVEVHALHVHHGLQAQADAWMKQVAAQCRRWSRAGHPVIFHARRLAGRPGPGESIEAWARRRRYEALADMAHEAGCGLVLLAQHRRDQAETVLLQALRGAGAAGLAGMPREARRHGLTWVRPWLDQPRQAIEAYARRWRLSWVDDPSNADERLARSRLRVQVWPTLTTAFPDVETGLAAVARRAQEIRLVANEVAVDDLRLVADGGGLRLSSWFGLSPPRRSNVLRHWLQHELAAPVPESLVQRLLNELPEARSGRWPSPAGELGLHADVLRLLDPGPAVCSESRSIDLSRPGVHRVSPWAGSIRVEPVQRGGVQARLLCHAELRPRQGGEQFLLRPRGVARSLKKQFQALRVPPWSRHGPLVFAGDLLVFVPGLGVDARAGAIAGSPRVELHWQA